MSKDREVSQSIRVWDHTHDKMIYDDVVAVMLGGKTMFGLAVKVEDVHGEGHYWTIDPGYNFEGMFGSGEKDVTGKEIFEGDLTHGPGSPTVFRVIFMDGFFGLVVHHTHSKKMADSEKEQPKIMPLHLAKKHGAAGYKVIGNVHEGVIK